MADPKKAASPPLSDADTALAALAELEQLKLRVQELDAELTHERAENKGLRAELERAQKLLRGAEADQRKALAELRAQFDRAWQERDDAVARSVAAVEATAPAAAKRYRARGNHTLVRDGARVKIVHGTPLPPDFDLMLLPHDGYEEV